MADVIITPVSESVFNVSVNVVDPDLAQLAAEAEASAVSAADSAVEAGEAVTEAQTAAGEASSSLSIIRDITDTYANFDSDIIQIIAYGQSLSVSGVGTEIDLYNTISFGGNVLTNYDPNDLAARDLYYEDGLTSMPSIGVESMKCIGRVVGQQIEAFQGIPKGSQEFQILINAPGTSGMSYYGLALKTNTYYRRLIESVRYAQSFAIADGKSFSAPALCWIQGENSADKEKTKAQVISDLTILFDELNSDIKAITGQETDVQFFVYQVASFLNNPPATVEVPLAHLELAETVENIHFGTAMYQYPYADNLHLTNAGYRIMASTFGSQIYQGIILRNKRSPIVPISYSVSESFTGEFIVYVKMFVPVSPLVFDTDFYSAQTNMGFSIKNTFGDEIITSVSLKRGEIINIVCSEDPTLLNIEYAIGGTVSGGNLRDSQGDSLKTEYSGVEYRVDNWAPIFRKPIPLSLSNQTELYFDNIDASGFSDYKKLAIDRYFRRMISSGLINKIERVYLPALGRVDGGVNMIIPTEANINFPSTDAIYTDEGINASAPWTFPFTKSISSIYLAAWNSQIVTSEGISKRAIDNSAGSFFVGRRLSESFTNGGVVMTSTARATFSGSGGKLGLMAASISEDLDVIQAYTDNVFFQKPGSSTIPTFYVLTPRISPTHGVPHALYAFGNYLTGEEMGLHEDYVTDLINGLSL